MRLDQMVSRAAPYSYCAAFIMMVAVGTTVMLPPLQHYFEQLQKESWVSHLFLLTILIISLVGLFGSLVPWPNDHYDEFDTNFHD